MAGSLTVLSAHRFKRSKEELQTAELLLRNTDYRSSINRSYYGFYQFPSYEPHASLSISEKRF